MRVVTGTSLAAGLILVACVTPSPQRTMNDAKAPYPLVIIDGVKRPDLPPTFRYTGAVVVETTTTPTYRITYRGPRVMDSVAKALYPSADEVESMQMIDPPASVMHFREERSTGPRSTTRRSTAPPAGQSSRRRKATALRAARIQVLRLQRWLVARTITCLPGSRSRPTLRHGPAPSSKAK